MFTGILFHPEFMLHHARFRHLFRRLVEAAAGHADNPAANDNWQSGGRSATA
jgi:CTP synthase (UTP-ammonia lyase)